MFVIVPVAVGLTTTWIVAVPPAVSVPSWHVITRSPLQVPVEGVAETNVTLAGRESVTTTAVAVSGPLFRTPSV